MIVFKLCTLLVDIGISNYYLITNDYDFPLDIIKQKID
jgi:hypothetical protein